MSLINFEQVTYDCLNCTYYQLNYTMAYLYGSISIANNARSDMMHTKTQKFFVDDLKCKTHIYLVYHRAQ